MAKRKVIRKSNRPFTYNPHYYSWGGNLKKSLSKDNIVKSLEKNADIIGSAVGNAANNTISGGLKSGAGSAISNIGGTIGGIASTIDPVLGGIISAGTGIIGGLTNRMFGSKLNEEKIAEVEKDNNAINTVMVDNSNADSIEDQWANQDFGADFSKSDIGKDGWFSNKAKNKYKELKKQQDIARNRALTSYEDAAEAADTQADLNAMANFAAFGGPLGIWGGYGNGVITNKGRLTSLPNLNARKWHYAFGGDLLTHGAEWNNGLRVVGNGGTHEENPMEGVPMGMDTDGNSNLVEQGEAIFNDYVFSNRLFADGGLLESFNLPKSYDGYSFAAIAEKLGDESKERPNDPISKRGLLSSMSRLQQAQETVRQQTQEGQEGVKYAHGGKMGILFDGFGDLPNSLDGTDYEDEQIYGTLLEPINAEDVWNKSILGIDKDDKKNNKRNNKLNNKLTQLRYAPVVGAAIGLGQNLFSKPDYGSANAILEAANQAGNYTPISYTPIGNYLQYRPFDKNFYLNKLNAQAGATRGAIMNTTGPSRDAALLAADYNAQGRLGDLARQAEEYNLAQRQAVEQFNRATNQANAEMGLKAAMANQEAAMKARSSRLSGVAQAMSVRDAIDARRNASMSANLTNFFNSLGDIGREEYSRNMIMSNPALYYSIDSKGNITYKNGYESLSEAEKKEIRSAANKAKGKKKAKGGYLTIKKK